MTKRRPVMKVEGGEVDVNQALGAARRVHTGQFTRSGEPLINHVERVASRESRATAYLHDALASSNGAEEELRRNGSTDVAGQRAKRERGAVTPATMGQDRVDV
jgi:(p)ppGpp synthase/HD superfamily hydrolase